MSWGTPNISSDKWAGKSIAGYDVSWDGGPLPRFAHVSGNSCSIHVDDAYRALSYEVTVKTVFQGGSSGGFASDSGFAISTQDLIWRDGGSNCSPAAAEQWYVTMLQTGFTYRFDF